MKAAFLLYMLCICSMEVFSQEDQLIQEFRELVNKSQADKSLMGTFKYKGGIAHIIEYKEMKTAIGKFIEIRWKKDESKGNYTAIFHNTMGYMTRSYFNIYKSPYEDYKVSKNKYCQEDFCIELVEGLKLPYISTTPRSDSDIREIK